MRGEDLRAVVRRFPTGVAVVTVDTGAQRVGLTVGSLVTLSLEPPLVGFAVSRQAALHELLVEAGACAISLLAGGQDGLAQHFARGVPPIAMWENIGLEPGEGPPLLDGAIGWLRCTLRSSQDAGTHAFFVVEVDEALAGPGGSPLVRVDGEYRPA